MQFSVIYLSGLAALAAAAPFGGSPVGGQAHPASPDTLRQRAGCDLSKVSPPAAPTPLPAAQGSLKKVLIGTGTQNYTCADGQASTIPAATGAVATLHDASCLAATNQDWLNQVTTMAHRAPPAALNNLLVAGHHYFSAPGVPTFEVDGLGTNNCKKGAASNAPNTADVTWLYLQGTSGQVKTVYRVETNGGQPPANCQGKQAGEFTVPYTAQYWMYA